jgi:flagellar motor switch protein FliM
VSNVSEEEVQALAEELSPESSPAGPAVVAPRDFSEPQRLGAERQSELRKTLQKTLAELNRKLTGWLRRPIDVVLDDIGEVDAATLFPSVEAPFSVLSFTSGSALGAAGWLVWDMPAVTAAAEVALGGDLPEELVERALSDVERSIVSEALTEIVQILAPALGIAVDGISYMQDDGELAFLNEQAEAGDTQRLSIHLSVRGLGQEESALRLYLPGIGTGNAAAGTEQPAAPLPHHLGPIPVELSAYLGSVDVALSDLLSLEIGDVIPLGVEVGSTVSVRVEDRACGEAHFGQQNGNLVLRIQDLDGSAEEQP